ncbi:STAS domain-containing protein [Peribacillus glennii]|uniref:STAS domain-containing protein n=1 Tax=Peribacillus glennii TaxID=2303991 RepID=A0A372L7K8_9BACI|nr:STAS domain-containing protein [Peribacillus glennii]RFU61248.1 STAS domain-containing protein [Peribacillus glennii]
MNKSHIKQMQEELTELRNQLNELEQLIKDMSVPVIPSIIPETFLLPITGKLEPERFELIISQISEKVYSEEINTIIIDFSAIAKKEIGDLDLFGYYINKLNSILQLLGVEVLYVGFTPIVSQELVRSGLLFIDAKTFLTFRSALDHLMKKKGLKLIHESAT